MVEQAAVGIGGHRGGPDLQKRLRRRPEPVPEFARGWFPHVAVAAVFLLALGPLLASPFLVVHRGSDASAPVWSLLREHHAKDLWQIVKRGLAVGACALCLGIAGAAFLKLVLSRAWRTVPLLLLSAPFLISEVTRTFTWFGILGREGYINNALVACHLVREPVAALLMSEFSVAVASTLAIYPLAVFVLLRQFDSVPHPVLRAAADLGASRFAVFAELLLPLSFRGALIAFVCCASLSINDGTAIRYLGGANEVSLRQLTFNLESSGRADAAVDLGLSFGVATLVLVVVSLIAAARLDALRRGIAKR